LVDTTTLIVIATVVQTIVLTITLVVFMLQFRSQEKSIREAAYQGLMGRYNDMIAALAAKPEVAKVMMTTLPWGTSFSDDEASAWGHLLMAYGIIEEAFLLYTRKWIDEDNWLQWSAFLEVLAKSPIFVRMQTATIGTFDPRFEKYVLKILEKRVSTGEKATRESSSS
jgi:hypothetical protein